MNRAVLLSFLGLIWLQVFLALIPSWRDGNYYAYGWLVPAATWFFVHRRLRELPVGPEANLRPPFAAWAMLFSAMAALAFLRIVEGGNVHWRLPLWLHGLIAVWLSFAAVHLTLGRRAARHLLPAILFALVAIPPPSSVEQFLVSHLTEAVTLTGGQIATLQGLPVVLEEAAFLVNGQPLDINDGCSGIRSFQSCLMAGLFVGELLRLPAPSRVALVMLAAAGAFVGNTFRVVLLVREFAAGGPEGLERAHDPAGLLALAISYGLVIASGFLMDRFNPAATVQTSKSFDHLPPNGSRRRGRGRTSHWLAAGIALMLATESTRLWWFAPTASGEAWSETPRLALDARSMENATPLRSLSVSEHVETGAIRYDSATFHRTPIEDDNVIRSLLFMEYRPGNPSLWNDLFTHPPEVCMRTTGCQLEATLPSRPIQIGGRDIPVRCLRFREPTSPSPLFIFKLVWLPESSPIQPSSEKPEKRPLWMQMAFSRMPSPPGSVLLARVQRTDDFEEAWRLFSEEMAAYLLLSSPNASIPSRMGAINAVANPVLAN